MSEVFAKQNFENQINEILKFSVNKGVFQSPKIKFDKLDFIVRLARGTLTFLNPILTAYTSTFSSHGDRND